jgi:hypothetical protein
MSKPSTQWRERIESSSLWIRFTCLRFFSTNIRERDCICCERGRCGAEESCPIQRMALRNGIDIRVCPFKTMHSRVNNRQKSSQWAKRPEPTRLHIYTINGHDRLGHNAPTRLSAHEGPLDQNPPVTQYNTTSPNGRSMLRTLSKRVCLAAGQPIAICSRK